MAEELINYYKETKNLKGTATKFKTSTENIKRIFKIHNQPLYVTVNIITQATINKTKKMLLNRNPVSEISNQLKISPHSIKKYKKELGLTNARLIREKSST